MSGRHVEDFVELYALGALTDRERAIVEEHLRVCVDCARLVGESERNVALIAASETQRTAPRELAARVNKVFSLRPSRFDSPLDSARGDNASWQLPVAVAAAFVIGLLPSLYFWNENRELHRAMVAQSSAMERLASAAHRSSAFHPMGAGPAAEVMYAPDGSWYFVVVRDVSKRFAVVWVHDGAHTMLGSAIPNGRVATLYLPKSHRMDRLALMDRGRIVAEATLSWGKRPPGRLSGRSASPAAMPRES